MRQTRSLAHLSTKWELNAHIPVSQLPTEILSFIFLFVRVAHENVDPKLPPTEARKQHPRDLSAEEQRIKEIGWIGVSHVCHRWRQAALGSAVLWTHIIIEDKKCRWAMEMLKRSEGSFLKMYIDLDVLERASRFKRTPAAVGRSALSSATKNLRRCNDLFIRGAVILEAETTLHSILDKCFTPTLKSLTVDVTVYDRSNNFRFSDSMVKSGSLRTLILSGALLDWKASFLHNLTTLSLIPQEPVASDVLLNSLASMPSLTSLDLDMTSVTIRSADIPLLKHHRLREQPMRLTYLSIRCFQSPLPATLILSFTAKKSIQLHVNVHRMSAGSSECADLFTEVSSRVDSTAQITGCHVAYFRRGLLVIHGFYTIREHAISCDKNRDPMAFKIQLQCAFNMPDFDQSTLFECAFDKLPIDHLRGLVVTGDRPLSAQLWKSTFGGLTTLKYISVAGYWEWTRCLFEALRDKEIFPSLGAIASILTPGISTDFNSGPLPQSLQSRLESGKKIQHLLLHGPGARDRYNFESIRDLVGRLEVAEDLS